MQQVDIESSFLSTIRTTLYPFFTSLNLQIGKQVFIKSPDIRVEEVVFPLVAINFQTMISKPAGLGKIGSGGKRQSKREIIANIGYVGKTSTQTKIMEELILNHFENCVFLQVHHFSKQGLKLTLVGHARVKPIKTEFIADNDTNVPGSDLAMCSYHLSYYVDL